LSGDFRKAHSARFISFPSESVSILFIERRKLRANYWHYSLKRLERVNSTGTQDRFRPDTRYLKWNVEVGRIRKLSWLAKFYDDESSAPIVLGKIEFSCRDDFA